jgi:putative hemolysin
MISVERSFYEKFPRLAEGRARGWSRPVVELLRRIACEERINRELATFPRAQGFAFVRRVLEHLDFGYEVANTDREHIPAEGPLVVVANHPLGALDALALLDLIGSVRRDVRIFANDMLGQFEPLKELLLPVDVVGGRAEVGSVREAFRALERGEALIVFPAGEVSRIRPSGVRDRRWSPSFVRFVRKTAAPVLPVHLGGHNSATFYGVSMLAKPLATLLLPREMFGHRGLRIRISVGRPVPPESLAEAAGDARKLAQRMRRHVYRLAKRRPPLFAAFTPVAHPENAAEVAAELARARVLGATSDGKRVLLVEGAADGAAMREIGRLRELTFRKVGEGTGMKRDLDRYDAHYRHIVLWDAEKVQICGAYRLAEGGRILDEQGLEGLYTSSLFSFAERARPILAEGIELGRSFVHPAYWGSRSLDYLWQGIGAYLKAHPRIRYLFGPVSISAQLPLAAREWIVAYHRRYFGDREGLARARNPFVVGAEIAQRAEEAFAGLDAAAAARRLKEELAALGATLPTLYRQYVDLCEPEGIRFLDFGVDPDFGGCVDGLIVVDLAYLKAVKRQRYLA